MKAIWNGAVIAESDGTVVVGGDLSPDAVWYCPATFEAAAQIEDRVGL